MMLNLSYPKVLRLVTLCLIPFISIACQKKDNNEGSGEKYITINPIQVDSSYTHEYVADIQSRQNVELRARITGFLEQINVEEGSVVTKGQLLFKLNVGGHFQEIQKSKSQLAIVQAELKQIDIEIKNANFLLESKVISNYELELLTTKKEAIIAKIKEAKATIILAEINLEYTEIRAPFTGIINRISNKKGSLIEEGTLLTTISDNSEMYAYFNVSETDYLNRFSKKYENKEVDLLLVNGTQFPESGLIETSDSEINRNTGNLSFRAKFPNPDKVLKHGSSGKVLVKNNLSEVILIPQQSTFEVQENLYVYIIDNNNIARQKQIYVDIRLGNMYVVSEGLSTSDKVLYEGVQLIKEGDKIKPEFKNYSQIK